MWSAPTTTDRDRKQLLRCLIEEVIVDVDREERRATLTIRWQGGALTELAVRSPSQQPAIRTDEDTIALLERLAAHYDDATIAGDPQPPRPPLGDRRAVHRRSSSAACAATAASPPTSRRPSRPTASCSPSARPPSSSASRASTLHRWLHAGFIAGEQDTPGAPWRIRVNDQLRALFVEDAPPGYVPIVDAMRILGVSRQTVLQRVKRGELQAIHIRNGRRKGLRIQVIPVPDTSTV